MGQMRLRISGLLLGAIFSALALGCSDPDVHTERAAFDDTVQSISVDVGSGDLTLRGSDVDTVAVTARIEGPTNHLGSSLLDGRLSLFDDCHEQHCSVDVTAIVPSGVPVELHSGSGDIELDDLLATILAHTGSGDITGAGLAGADLSAETGSGDVSLDVSESAEQIVVRTGSGDVALSVPAGGYSLTITTGSGDRHVSGIDSDSGAASSIAVSTGSGDVVIRGY